jgi:ABC-2 type transport system ATP-binding protein
MSVIQVENLGKTFSYYRKSSGLRASIKNLWSRQAEYKEAVSNVSFNVEKGEIVGFLGPNGAGKTTTMKILSGILHPTTGTAKVMGYCPWERQREFKMRFSIVMGQKQQLWPDLPAIDSFTLNQHIYEITPHHFKQRVDKLSEILNVGHLLEVQIRRLSLGERMKMELIAALLHQPDVVFLDEPTLGLDFLSQKAILSFLQELASEQQTTMLLTSHNMTDISTLCKRALVIREGQLIYDGGIDQLNTSLGGYRRIRIKTDNTMKRSAIEVHGKLLEFSENEALLEVPEKLSRQVLGELMSSLELIDIHVEEQPLDVSLERLYQQ